MEHAGERSRARPAAVVCHGVGGVGPSPPAVGVVSAVTGGPASAAPTSTPAPRVDAGTSWTVYHGNPLGTGVDTSGVTFSPANPAWTSPWRSTARSTGNRSRRRGVFTRRRRTTRFTQCAARGHGAILWSSNVGTPVPSSALPCGDISPTVGITGTPVIDTARGEIFAVADVLSGERPDPPARGAEHVHRQRPARRGRSTRPARTPPAILQRTGLNLSDGNVVFGYGGNDGDCSTYSGWVVSVPEGGGGSATTRRRRSATTGPCGWAGRRPRSTCPATSGRATGNGSSSNPYDFSDSVIELSAGAGPASSSSRRRLVR